MRESKVGRQLVCLVMLLFYNLYFDFMLMLIFLCPGKAQDLKKDIEILSQTFERIIDRKEAIIKSLVKDIEEAEEQYEMALRSHLQNQDNLIGVTQVKSC